jgi:hypothetical protein
VSHVQVKARPTPLCEYNLVGRSLSMIKSEFSCYFIQVPREPLVFMIRAVGGEVSWCDTAAPGATYPESDPKVSRRPPTCVADQEFSGNPNPGSIVSDLQHCHLNCILSQFRSSSLIIWLMLVDSSRPARNVFFSCSPITILSSSKSVKMGATTLHMYFRVPFRTRSAFSPRWCILEKLCPLSAARLWIQIQNCLHIRIRFNN